MKGATVFVNGIWKSGNHLVYSALNELGVPGPYNGISAHLVRGRMRLAKQILRAPRTRQDRVQVGLATDVFVSGDYIARVARRQSGSILGGHAAHTPELQALLRRFNARMIFIRRDPRDVLVSFADWICARPDFYMYGDFAGLSKADRIRKLLHGGEGSGYTLYPFTTALKRCEAWLDAPDVLQVSFETLIGASGGGDAALQADVIRDLHAHVNAPIPLHSVDAQRVYGGTLTFNKGRVGRWRELEDGALVDEIDNHLHMYLEKWGYST